MRVFSKKSLASLEEVAPHLLTRIAIAEEASFTFPTYTLPDDADRFVCIGCGIPPEGRVGKWILIEPSVSRLRAFLQTDESTRFFEGSLEHISLGDEGSLRVLAWFLFDKPFALVDGGCDDFSAFATEFIQRIEGTAHLFNEYADFGMLPIKNTLLNLKNPLSDPLEYKDSQKGADALVVGAGPSLKHALHHVKAVKDQVVIIGCGSAVQLLLEEGIIPDFATCLDPAPPMDRYSRIDCSVPLIFLSRLAPDVAAHFHGAKICVGANGCHPLEAHLLEHSGVKQLLQGGWNAGTLGVEWAQFLGCDRLFTVGIDTTKSGYAGAIEEKGSRNQAELRETKKWLDGICPIPSSYAPQGKKNAISQSCVRKADVDSLQKELLLVCKEALHAVRGIQEGGKAKVLFLFELEQNFLYNTLLTFLWEIWKDRYENQEEAMRLVFFNNVLAELTHILETGI